jgi:hypothetical protein
LSDFGDCLAKRGSADVSERKSLTGCEVWSADYCELLVILYAHWPHKGSRLSLLIKTITKFLYRYGLKLAATRSALHAHDSIPIVLKDRVKPLRSVIGMLLSNTSSASMMSLEKFCPLSLRIFSVGVMVALND